MSECARVWLPNPCLFPAHTLVHAPLPQSNEVQFSVAGFNIRGSLDIAASYAPSPAAPGRRVDIAFESARLSPPALEAVFKSNYDLLLGIFNPEGWLEVTYLDGELRVGRDDKGHVFVLERCG